MLNVPRGLRIVGGKLSVGLALAAAFSAGEDRAGEQADAEEAEIHQGRRLFLRLGQNRRHGEFHLLAVVHAHDDQQEEHSGEEDGLQDQFHYHAHGRTLLNPRSERKTICHRFEAR